MRHLDLFSGIGGFALAARWAGIETVGFCEIEDFPRKVLAKNFPGVKIHGDIKNLNGEAYKNIDLITGGFPCQPFSVAGKQGGTEDDRYIWPEMLRVIKQARPSWAIIENVPGIIQMALDKVLFDLEGENYSARTLILPACAVNAPHRRDRVWIIAHDNSLRVEREGAKLEATRADKLAWYNWEGVASGLLRSTNGIPNRVDRLKSLGNAIVPQVAYEIMKAIKLAS